MIAKNGNKKKNKLLLKILEERIDSNNNIDDTLAIIDSIPFDKYDGSEKRILITRLEQYLEDQKETIEEQTNERIKKIIQSINS